MSFSSGPNTVNDSIVFNYDTGDTKNSFKGQPTTNQFAVQGTSGFGSGADNAVNFSIQGEAGFTRLGFGQTFGNYTIQPNDVVYRYNWNFSPNACHYHGNSAAIPSGVYATFTVDYFISSDTNFATGNSTLLTVFENYGGGGLGGSANMPNYDKGVWQTLTFTSGPTGATGTQAMFLYPGGCGGNIATTTGYILFKNPQVVFLNYTVPFVQGTRSSTQGLLDISGRENSVSLANVSFDSSGQITFDGTDDYISVDNSSALQVGDVFTVSAWIYPTNLNSRQGVFTTRRNNTTGCWQLEVGTASGGINRVAVTGIGTWIFETPDNVISPNTWTNICFVKTSNAIQGGILYVNGVAITPQVTTAYNIANNSDAKIIGAGTSLGSPFPGRIANVILYNRVLTPTEVANNYIELRGRFSAPIYTYSEGSNASLYVSNWNNSTTYTMADFGGIPNVTAHGFSSGPVTYTLTLNNLPPHTRIRYKVLWHLVDSLDNETNQLFIMDSSGGETEILRFTKQYNLVPNISVAASPGTYTWAGAKSYTYRPWAGGYYGQDGYIIVDSGLVNHTSTTFTARHVMGADQAQADEAEYLSHVLVELYN
jgi:hypothetical protein